MSRSFRLLHTAARCLFGDRDRRHNLPLRFAGPPSYSRCRPCVTPPLTSSSTDVVVAARYHNIASTTTTTTDDSLTLFPPVEPRGIADRGNDYHPHRTQTRRSPCYAVCRGIIIMGTTNVARTQFTEAILRYYTHDALAITSVGALTHPSLLAPRVTSERRPTSSGPERSTLSGGGGSHILPGTDFASASLSIEQTTRRDWAVPTPPPRDGDSGSVVDEAGRCGGIHPSVTTVLKGRLNDDRHGDQEEGGDRSGREWTRHHRLFAKTSAPLVNQTGEFKAYDVGVTFVDSEELQNSKAVTVCPDDGGNDAVVKGNVRTVGEEEGSLADSRSVSPPPPEGQKDEEDDEGDVLEGLPAAPRLPSHWTIASSGAHMRRHYLHWSLSDPSVSYHFSTKSLTDHYRGESMFPVPAWTQPNPSHFKVHESWSVSPLAIELPLERPSAQRERFEAAFDELEGRAWQLLLKLESVFNANFIARERLERRRT